ncbi:transglutaminase-like domain-containing protein [Helicobacter sp. 11S03491-1]|uniref:transglutaminase-like domain-containing protein n=1 Tax=Helicobacter sp. 11S03491-1 TaxID=1476196 RepID=UPI000BA54DB7|nr:transglutaminase-like domain-containing protein [Helicobacter sp. 11S03491-1]PAF42639.1 hypothetical protein BKH45_03770 [Helicobacter sp. 11S03491-1]
MKRRDFIKTGILGTGIFINANIIQANDSKSKKFSLKFSYEVNFDSAKEIKLYIPMPLTTDFQQPSNMKIWGNYDFYKTYRQNNVPIIYAQYSFKPKPKIISIQTDILLSPRASQENLENPEKFLQSSRYIRTDGIIKQLASKFQDKNEEKTIHNIYGYLKHHLHYQQAKNIEGIRNIHTKNAAIIFPGENVSATTLFVSLCRACKIPAREALGIELGNPSASIVTKAEVFFKQNGWIPYDIIASIKNPHYDGRGKWEENFVLLNYQKDIQIEKYIISSFGSAFGLVDGDNLNYYENKKFIKNISFKHLS